MTGKYKGLRSYSQGEAVTAPRKIKRGGKTETLSYINANEASVLKRLGGSGERTQYGGVPSYYGVEDAVTDFLNPTGAVIRGAKAAYGAVSNYFSGSGSGGGTGGQTATGRQGITSSSASSAAARHAENMRNQRSGGSGDQHDPQRRHAQSNQRPRPQNRTEYKDGPKPSLSKMYGMKGDPDGLRTYLATFDEETTSTETNETGGTTTYITRAGNEGIPDDFADNASDPETWSTDNKGNIIGYNDESGEPVFQNKSQWLFDGNEESWVFVGEGSESGGGGTGTTEVVSPDGTSKTVGARTYAQMLGYDHDKLVHAEKERATSVKEMKSMAAKYQGKYNDATGEFEGGLSQKYLDQADQADMLLMQKYGVDVQVTDPKTGEVSTQKGDSFWKDMEDEAGKLPTSMQDHIAGKRMDEVTASETDQMSKLNQMLSDRQIDPNSPMAMRMRQKVSAGTRTAKREVKRQSLNDAMAIQQQQQQAKLGIRGQQTRGLADIGGRKAAQSAMYGAAGQGISSDLTNMNEDERRKHEAAKLGGMQIGMARDARIRGDDVADKIAAMKPSGQGGGGGGTDWASLAKTGADMYKLYKGGGSDKKSGSSWPW